MNNDISKIISLIQVCCMLARIPSGGRNLFLIAASLARRYRHSNLNEDQLKGLIDGFIGNNKPFPILLKKISQFRSQLMPLMIPYPKIYKSVFEDLLSIQVSWFEGFKKYKGDVFIIYGDMVGFSKSAQKHNFDAAIKILNFRHVFFSNFKDKGGYSEASGGDSILAIFKDGDSAVEASKKVLKISKKIGIGARIGISYGDYLSDGQGRPLIGASINTAVRVADGGSKISQEDEIWCLNGSRWVKKEEKKDVHWGIWFSWKAIKNLSSTQGIIKYLSTNNNLYEIRMYYKYLKGVSDGTGLKKGKVTECLNNFPMRGRKGRNFPKTLFFGIIPKNSN